MTPYGRGEAWEDNPEGWPVIGDVREGHPSEARVPGPYLVLTLLHLTSTAAASAPHPHTPARVIPVRPVHVTRHGYGAATPEGEGGIAAGRRLTVHCPVGHFSGLARAAHSDIFRFG